ncbi:MAG: threonylcarbamoyl-AMP synthase [Chloroflexi bacterium]|nr:threonylcarbamoyl-AMP synthase [Chloroflexota bacterium]
MRTKTVKVDEAGALDHAVDVLHNGGVVAFPTDTVYGLGAMAFDEDAIFRLYLIKGRNHSKAVVALINKVEDLEGLTTSPSETSLCLTRHFWPGPMTIILPRHPDVPDILSEPPNIGVRIPDHPVALDLLDRAGPLGVTSANISGLANTTSADQVLDQLEGRIHLVLDGGRTPGGVPSTVVECTDSEINILRPGPITKRQIMSVLAKERRKQ